jgi:hypothetical protein
MSISDYLELKILDKVFRNVDFTVSARHISLHTGDPGETGANEVTGGSYGRQGSASFDAAASGATQNSGALTFAGMPAATITHFGVWDTGSGGNFLWGGALSQSWVVPAGASVDFGAGDIDITLD